MYRDIRNKIVNQYREDSSRHLTYTACRQALGGDANVILRIWTFLDDWGLINFQAKPRDSHADTHLQTTTSDGKPLTEAGSCYVCTAALSDSSVLKFHAYRNKHVTEKSSICLFSWLLGCYIHCLHAQFAWQLLQAQTGPRDRQLVGQNLHNGSCLAAQVHLLATACCMLHPPVRMRCTELTRPQSAMRWLRSLALPPAE